MTGDGDPHAVMPRAGWWQDWAHAQPADTLQDWAAQFARSPHGTGPDEFDVRLRRWLATQQLGDISQPTFEVVADYVFQQMHGRRRAYGPHIRLRVDQ